MAANRLDESERGSSNGNVYDRPGNDPAKPLHTPVNDSGEEAGDSSGQSGSSADLSRQERQAGNGRAENSGSSDEEAKGLYNPSKDADKDDSAGNKSLLGKAKDGKQKLRDAATQRVGRVLKNKWAVGILFGTGISAGTIIVLLILAIGTFKIPNFAEHIASYQFARVTRDFARNADNVTNAKMAVESADDTAYGRIKARYGDAQGKVSDTWHKLDKYRPQQVIKNMKASDRLEFNYQPTRLGRQQLKGVTIDNKTVVVQHAPVRNHLIPGHKLVGDARFVQEFYPTLHQAMVTDDVGPIVRGQVARNLRKQLGISLIAWNIGKYRGKTDMEARAVLTQEAHEKIKGSSSATNPKIASEKLNETAEKAAAAEEAAVNDPEKIKEIVANPNEPHQDVQKVIDEAFDPEKLGGITSQLKSLLGVINPVYAVATPLCLIYDGSLTSAGPTINEQSAQAERAFYFVQSAASQQKDGYHANGEAVGATNWKLGDIENSNPELRASGKPISTTNYTPTQASATGQMSITDVLFPEPIDSMADQAATVCPVFTNVWVGVGLGAANIVAVVVSGGTTGAGQAAITTAAQTTMRTVVQRVTSKLIASKTYSAKIAKDTAKQGALIGGATLLAKYIVMSQMGATHSATAVGVPFDNHADNGGDLHAEKVQRFGLHGRPLTAGEIAMNNLEDQQYLASKMRSQSAYQRYLAPDNAHSLLAKVASSISNRPHAAFASSVSSLGDNVLHPLKTVSTIVRSATAKVGAAGHSDNDYRNVQWGTSPEEDRLIKTDPTYSLLENQRILDQSGREQEIADKYGVCYDMNKQMGELLTEETGQGGDEKYYIVRDAEGNVDPNQGLCSPRSLGHRNPQYGDLVFRWRLANGLAKTQEQLDEMQNPTEQETDAAPAAAAPDPGTPVNVADLFKPSDNIPCPAGTDDAGVHEGWHKMKSFPIRLCGIPGFPSTSSESVAGSRYYIPGSKGNALVNSRMAGNVLRLVNDAKAAGVPMKAVSSYRTMAHQRSLCPCGPGTGKARPGESNHQAGMAIDFDLADGKRLSIYGYPTKNGGAHSPSNPRVAPGSPVWTWLNANAHKYGMKQLYFETWHWSASGN